MRERVKWARGLIVIGVLIGAWPVRAQISSEAAPRGRTIPLREQVKWEAENAPYRLGPVKVRPLFDLRDFGYNNNVFGTEADRVSDFTATVSAGASLLLPLGSKMALMGTAAPEYTWYEKLVERRSLGGNYGGSLLGLFNRMTLEGGGAYVSQVSIINSESEQSAVVTRRQGFGRFEIEVLQYLSLFGGFDGVKTRYDDKGFQQGSVYSVDLLDRTELAWRGGIRYRLSEQVGVGTQLEKTRADFVRQSADRDNESTGYLLVARYDRPRFYIDVSGGYREGSARNPDPQSQNPYPGYRTGTYSFFASYFISRDLELQVLGHRRPVDSYFLDNPYYFETRSAAALQWALGRKISIRGYVSVGPNVYPTQVLVGPDLVTRRDDVTELGCSMLFRLYRNVSAVVGAAQSRYTSNIDGLTRSVFRLSSGLSLKGDFSR